MKLSVPTNWQKELLGNINTKDIEEFYGKLNTDFFGGGRASCAIPRAGKTEASGHIKQIRRKGIEFNYLLNATCLDNAEWTRYGQKQINRFLDWLLNNDVRKVTVAVPYLVELIKKRFPDFKVTVSVQAGVDCLDRARFWENLGADEITLSVVDVNRDFKLFKQLKDHLKVKLKLIANLPCLKGCPFYKYHANLNAHASQKRHPTRYFVIDYCMLRCQFIKLSQPWQLIKSGWIRPESLIYYERSGIDSIKLVDRGMDTKYILKIVEAYTAGKYTGNLFDIFPSPAKNMAIRDRNNMLHKLKYFFRPGKINLLRLYKARDLVSGFDIYLDNQKLEGFLQYYLDDEHSSGRSEDDYCKEIADKALSFDNNSRKNILAKYNDFLKDVISGELFFYNLRLNDKESPDRECHESTTNKSCLQTNTKKLGI